MCSQGAFGGALRCPEYAKDLPRNELIEVLKTQFIRRGFSIDVPADAYDEARWNRDEVAVFFQSGGSVKPRCTLLVEAGIDRPGDGAAVQAAPTPQRPDKAVLSADEAARAADFSIPTVRLSLEGRMLRAELMKSQEQDDTGGSAAASAAKKVAPVTNQPQAAKGVGGGGGVAAQLPVASDDAPNSADSTGQEDNEEELLGWAGF